MPVLEHCEDPSLKGEGVAHEGYHASTLGLRGIPGAAEAIMVAARHRARRDDRRGGAHLPHERGDVAARGARRQAATASRVTCEVAPHHFTLTDESLATPVSYDTNMKMNPPLRAAADRDEMLRASSTAASTRLPPTTRRITTTKRRWSSTSRPSASSGWRRACRSASTGSCIPGSSAVAAGRAAVDQSRAHPQRSGRYRCPRAPSADITVLAPDLAVTVDPAKFDRKRATRRSAAGSSRAAWPRRSSAAGPST